MRRAALVAVSATFLSTVVSADVVRQLPASRRPIVNYQPNRYASGRAVGLPSDDTQLAFWTLEHLLEHDRIVPERLLVR